MAATIGIASGPQGALKPTMATRTRRAEEALQQLAKSKADEDLAHINTVIVERSISERVADHQDPAFVGQAVSFFGLRQPDYDLLALSMCVFLIHDTEARCDDRRLKQLALALAAALRDGAAGDVLSVVVAEVRSACFWRFVRGRHSDRELIEVGTELLAAFLRCDSSRVRQTEAALTQGYRGFVRTRDARSRP